MEAKKAAIVSSGILILFGLIDFTNRLTIDNDLLKQQQGQTQQTTSAVANGGLLSVDAVNQLFDWADIAAEPNKVAIPSSAVVVAPPVVVTPPKPLVDVHKQVQALIAGDVSKQLVGDDLLTLRGIFYDGKDFASIQIENIKTKEIKYIKLTMGVQGRNYQLVEIGKYHVVLSRQERSIKLQLFK